MALHVEFPLSAAARIDIALRVMKAELPFRVNDLPSAQGLKLSDHLLPSSPVLKKGFEPDARDWLRVLSAIDSPASHDDIRTLSRLRDRWAHQQSLTQNDATKFCETAADLMNDLEAQNVSRVLFWLTSPPQHALSAAPAATSYRDMAEALDLDPDDASDRRSLMKTMIWQACAAMVTAKPVLAITLVNDLDDTPDALPPAYFNWVIGLSSDAPAHLVREGARHVRALLEDRDEDAY